MTHSAFPVGLRLSGRSCLVVGSGSDSERRTRDLLDYGAHVTLVSTAPTPLQLEQRAQGTLRLRERELRDEDVEGMWLVVLTDRAELLAERLARLAEQQRCFFCAVDQPSVSSFFHLALVREGLVTVAISTSGRVPALGRKLKHEFARVFSEAGLATFAAELAELREKTPRERRRKLLDRALAGVRLLGLKLERRDR